MPPTDAERLLQAATGLKWIRDDALDECPALPASTDEINAVIRVLERIAAQLVRDVPDEWESVEFRAYSGEPPEDE